MGNQGSAEETIRTIKRKTRRKYSGEEKIRIVVEGLRGEESIAALCRREGISQSLYYKWSKEFLEAGKARLIGDTKRQASRREVEELRQRVQRRSYGILVGVIGGPGCATSTRQRFEPSLPRATPPPRPTRCCRRCAACLKRPGGWAR